MLKMNFLNCYSRLVSGMKNIHFKKTQTSEMKSGDLNLGVFIAYSFFGLFTAFIIYSIMSGDWVLGDQYTFAQTFGQGKVFSWGQNASNLGRFDILKYQEFSVLHFIPAFSGGIGAYVWLAGVNAVCFFVFAFFFFRLLCLIVKECVKDDFSSNCVVTVLCFIALTVSPSFMRLFWDIIFPDKMVVVAGGTFLYFYYSAFRTDKIVYYLLSFFSVLLLTYYKETAVVFSIVPIGLFFLFSFKTLSIRHKIFLGCLMLNVIIFFLLYYFLIYKEAASFYNVGRTTLGRMEIIKNILQRNYFLWGILVLFLVRGCLILFFKAKKHLFYDSCLFSGIAYIVSFIILRLHDMYYYAPAYVFLFPPFLYWICCTYKWKKYLPLCLSFVFIIIFVQNFSNEKNLYNGHQYASRMDQKFLNDMAQKVHQGKKIYYYTHKFEMPKYAFSNLRQDAYYIYMRDFLQFYSNKFNDENLVRRIYTLPDKLPQDSIIISSPVNREYAGYGKLSETLQQDLSCFFVPNVSNFCYDMYIFQENIPVSLPLNVDFSRTLNFQTKGLEAIEKGGRWTGSHAVQMIFFINSVSSDLKVQMKFFAFLPQEIAHREVQIFANGQFVEKWNLRSNEGDYIKEFIINKKFLTNGKCLVLQFKLSSLRSPKELGMSCDDRKLGIFLQSMKLMVK